MDEKREQELKSRAAKRQTIKDENANLKRQLRMAKDLIDGQGADIIDLQKSVISLQNDLNRARDEIEAERAHVQMLGDEYNSSKRRTEKEVARLRELLKSNKIQIP